MGSSSRRLLNHYTHSNVANSTASKERHGGLARNKWRDFLIALDVCGLARGWDGGAGRPASSASPAS